MSKYLKKIISIVILIVISISTSTINAKANSIKNTNQIITVIGTGGYRATVSLYEKNSNDTWSKKISTNGFVGKNGITDNKIEGDGKTPAGLYNMGTGFGIASNPGTNISYRKITNNDYWVDDPNSKYYNKWVDITQVKKDWNSAEHLCYYKEAYKYGVVINYNTDPVIPYKGSAIFLHNSTGGYTAGCVSIPEDKLVEIMKLIKPDAKILIAKDKYTIPESDDYKKTLTTDIYKYDAGKGNYLTYINGRGYSQYSYLNKSGKYAFTPSSWMIAAGLNVTMPTSSNGYKMYITNPYIKMVDEANLVLNQAKQGKLSSRQIESEIVRIENLAKDDTQAKDVNSKATPKKTLTTDIYKHDAGKGNYLTYINGRGYSQYSYLNTSGKYAFTPSSWMTAAGLNVTMPTSSNGYKMYITNPHMNTYKGLINELESYI